MKISHKLIAQSPAVSVRSHSRPTLGRPLNLLACAAPAVPPDFAALAASYPVGLAKNHPFYDSKELAIQFKTSYINV